MEFREKPMQNLIRIKEKEICKNVQALLLDGESIVGAYKTGHPAWYPERGEWPDVR